MRRYLPARFTSASIKTQADRVARVALAMRENPAPYCTFAPIPVECKAHPTLHYALTLAPMLPTDLRLLAPNQRW